MNKKILITAIALTVVLATFVYAATLVQETKVVSCIDNDGGLNFSVKGIVSVVDFNQSSYLAADYCVNNGTLNEYACGFANNATTLQAWWHKCTCVAGRCV